MALQLRRGTNQQRLGLTPVEGEMIYITDSVLVSISVTGIDTGTETLTTSVEHGLSLNQQIKFIGTTLNGLTKDQVYFVKTTPTTSSFTLSTSLGGGTLNITGTYSVPLVFAKTPCDASGAPIGYTESALWAGDGTTVGGLAVGITNIDALNDVDITEPAVEGDFLWYNGTSWVNTHETTVEPRDQTLGLTRRTTSVGENYENEVALRLNSRVTDTNSYLNNEGGPAIEYLRSSGTEYTKSYVSGGASGAFTVTLNNVTNLVVGHRVTGNGLPKGYGGLITVIAGNQITLDTAFTAQASGTYTIGAPIPYGHIAMEWQGTDNNHRYRIATSTDAFLEDPPNTYPGTNVIFEATKNYTNINSGVLYVDKTNVRIGINDTGPDYDITVFKPNNATLGLINSERTFVLTNDASNDLLSFSYGGANRLQFDLTNQWFNTGRLGVATASPNYTLDVNGTANVETSLTVPSITTLTGDNLSITAFSGRDVTISTTAAADPVTIVRNSSTTDSAIRTLTIRANSTETPTTGFGNSLEFEVENASNAIAAAAYISINSTNITAGAETFDMNFGLMNAGAAYNNKMSLSSTGNLQIDGDLSVSGGNINAGADDIILSIERTTTGTSGVFRRALILNSPTIGTPSVGYGTAMSFTGQTSSTNFEDAGYIAVQSTDNTGGSEDFKMSFGLMQNGATYADKMVLSSVGDLEINGSITSANYNTNNTGTISLFNSNATGALILGAATSIAMGNIGGDTTINGRLNIGTTLQANSNEDVANGAAMSIGTAASYFTTGATGETATLAAGNNGQFKSLAMLGDGGGDMVVTVTNAGWKSSGTGTITFNDIGDSCLLHYINSKWFAVGQNGVSFA